MIKLVTLVFVVLVALFISFSTVMVLLRAQDDLAVGAGVLLAFLTVIAFLAGLRLARSRRIIPMALLALVAGGCTRIEPGYSGIVVNQWGEDKGVQSYPLVTGRVTYNPISTDVLEYPNFMQSGEWSDFINPKTAIYCNDRDGLPVGFNLAFGYQLDPAKIPAFYVKYRTEDIRAFSMGFLRNEAQGAFNAACPRYTAEQIFGTAKEEILQTVRNTVNEKMAPEGIGIQQFSIIGRVILPAPIEQAIENKIRATQRAQQVENELRESEAAAKKRVADARGEAESAIEKARGQAEANRLLTQSLSAQLLDWRRLTIQETATQKWNGALPVTMLGDSVPMIQVPRQ